jgi:pantoate--beta-alanine ligase
MSQAPPLPVVRTVAALRAVVADWRRDGEKVALVPTMGALHDGHASLIRLARSRAERTIATIFVNPKQFGPNEDFAAYPRGEAADAALLAAKGCDLLYAPGVEAIYPQGFATTVSVSGLTTVLDGAARPGHFDGVATVVTKLLTQAGPDLAVFGEKDYQQLLVIRRLARDLDLPVEIVGAPTARAEDGLALSSRNAYLDPQQRLVAGRLNIVLAEAAAALARGSGVAPVVAAARARLLAAGFERVDYVEARGAEDLSEQGPGPIAAPSRLFAAAWLGRARLIDNMAI